MRDAAHLLGILGGGNPSAVLGMHGIAAAVPAVVPIMLAYAVVNHMLVVAVIWMSNPRAARSVLCGTGEDYLLELVTLSLGAIAAVLVAANPALLLPAPLLLVQRTVVLRQLSEAIQLDPRTGLLTVAALRSRAARLLGGPRSPLGLRRRETRRPIGVLMGDLDHVKEINDRFGHLAGAEVLCRIAEVFRSGVDAGDLVARFGGEEFLVLLARPRDDRDAEQVVAEAAERLRVLVSSVRPAAARTPGKPVDLSADVADRDRLTAFRP